MSPITAQAISGENPLRPTGFINLSVGLIRSLAGLVALYTNGTAFQYAIKYELPTAQDTTVSAVGIAIGGFLLLGGLKRFLRGIGQLGHLMVPPRAPADFASSTDLTMALERQELAAYRLPEKEEYWLAHKFFPHKFPLLPHRIRWQLNDALRAVSSAAWWCLGGVSVLWGYGLFSPSSAFAIRLVPSALVLFALAAAAAFRLAFVHAQVKADRPTVDRSEFRLQMSGGGDPKQIPIGLEHELMSLQGEASGPNRGGKQGFEMRGGGVKDSGEYSGSILIETQPALISPSSTPLLNPMLAVVLLLALLGTGLAALTPSYAQAIDLSNPELAFPAAARWASRLLGALLLLRASDGALHQVEHFLSVFRFRSTAVLVSVQGTFGRAGIKVGKALNDSIESENVVVRSDSSVVGFVAQIESESVGLLGNRSIVGLRSDSSVDQVRELIQQWFERFQAKGADIAGLDITSEKVTQMIRANIAIDAQRAGAKSVAEIQAQRSTSELLVPKATPELLLSHVTEESASTEQRGSTGNFSLGGAGMTDPNSVSIQAGTDAEMKVCPECAEPIRKAAVKCRFCNFRFDG